MAFWFTFIGMTAFFVLAVFFGKMERKAPGWSKKETFFNISQIVSGVVATLCAIAVFIMLLVIIVNNSATESTRADLEQRHDILVYQLENNLYDNDNDLGLKDLYDDVSAYNSEVVKGKVMQRNFWWGIFYPNIYDNLEFVDYERGE